jgi:hypothetical protein
VILPHNLDVMHQERNVAESIISMVFYFKDKTKDNLKAGQDLVEICVRPTGSHVLSIILSLLRGKRFFSSSRT